MTIFVHQIIPQQRDLELFSAPVHTAKNEHLGRLYVFRDITHERAVERMKSEFLAQVRHELNTPLTVLQGYLELLLRKQFGPINTAQEEALTIMGQTVDHFSCLVSDLLDISRLESGPVELQRSQVDVLLVLQQVVESLRPRTSEKQQTLTLHGPPDLPTVSGDVNRLLQVFLNLLINAHQYTPAGGQIDVRVALEGSQVRIEVQDTGRGMSVEEQAQAFTRFYRVFPFTDTEAMGLGLTIAHILVERHDGSISVKSTPGLGSTFTVCLPARKMR